MASIFHALLSDAFLLIAGITVVIVGIQKARNHTATNVGRLSVAGQSDPRVGDCGPRERSPELSTKVDICVNGLPLCSGFRQGPYRQLFEFTGT